MPKDFFGSFGDAFLKAYQYQQDAKRQQEEFNQKMAFDERQAKLADQFRRDSLQQDADYKRFNLQQDYIPVPEGTPFSQSGGQLNQQLGTLGEAFPLFTGDGRNRQEAFFTQKDLLPNPSPPEKNVELIKQYGHLLEAEYTTNPDGTKHYTGYNNLFQLPGYNVGGNGNNSNDNLNLRSKVSPEIIGGLSSAIEKMKYVKKTDKDGVPIYSNDTQLNATADLQKYSDELLQAGNYYDYVNALNIAFQRGASFNEGIAMLQEAGYDITRPEVNDLMLYYQAQNPSVFKLPKSFTDFNLTIVPGF